MFIINIFISIFIFINILCLSASTNNLLQESFPIKFYNSSTKFLPFQKFTINSILPAYIYSPPILDNNSLIILKILLIEFQSYLREKNITYSLIFGSLLSAVRNGILILPYDDDIDIVIPSIINNTSINKILTNNLITAKHSYYCSYLNKKKGNCKVWKLKNNLILTWKKKGVNLKVSYKGRKFPFIDVYTYSINRNIIFIPSHQLINGHVFKFQHKFNDVFPLQSIKINFSGENINTSSYNSSFRNDYSNNQIVVNIMSLSKKILQKDYGNDCLTICKTSHNHHSKRFVNSSFPCKLLPEKYYHHNRNNTKIKSYLSKVYDKIYKLIY